MNDDDITPRWRGPIVGRERELAEDRRRHTAPARGVPIAPRAATAPGQDTLPHELLERDLSEAQIEILRRSRRNSDDPATYADVVKLADKLLRERSETRQREQAYEAVLEAPHRHGRAARRWSIAAIIAAAIGGGTGGAGLAHQREDSGTEHLQHELDRIDIELREMRALVARHIEAPAGGEPASKGRP